MLLEAIRSQDVEGGGRDAGAVFDLARLVTARPAAELAEARGKLEALAVGGNLAVTRQLGFVSLIASEGSVEHAWEVAVRSVKSLKDLLDAMPFVADPGLRASLYPRVLPLLDGLPKGLATEGPKAKGTFGRYVRVELPRRGTLTLAEVEVFSDGKNVAREGKASQKATGYGGEASRGIDGNTNADFGAGGQTHTPEDIPNPWWEVDLGSDRPIDSVAVYNREGYESRLSGYTLTILDGARKAVFERKNQPAPKLKAVIEVGGGGPEGLVRRAAMAALTGVRGQEASTFKALARFVKSGEDRQAAVRAIQRIPAAYWPPEETRPLLDSLIAQIRTIPAADRTSAAALDALQLADALAGFLPRDEARKVRRELGDLGVRVIRMGAVPDQMLFDKDRVVVEAGKPVEVVFENNDLMPHNFVVTRPGALEKVGLNAEETATQPGALERNFVPRLPEVLFSTKLVPPRESDKVAFKAPSEPGVYPYVCTYPGHWRRMYGALYVVADLDDYLADPESYLKSHPLPVLDDLLKSNRPRKEWAVADLAPSGRKNPKGCVPIRMASRCFRSRPASRATSSTARATTSGRTSPSSTPR